MNRFQEVSARKGKESLQSQTRTPLASIGGKGYENFFSWPCMKAIRIGLLGMLLLSMLGMKVFYWNW